MAPLGSLRLRWPALAFFLWIILLTVVPFSMILTMSFFEKDPLGTFSTVFTLSNYARCFDILYAKVLWKTVALAGVATFFCLLIGFPVAYHLAKSKGVMKNLGLILLFIPFWTNFILRVHGMFSIFGSQGLVNQGLMSLGIIDTPLEILFTRTGVFLGLVYNYLPFLVVPIYSSLEKFDSSLREAAFDLGANRIQTFWRVVVPNIKGGVVIGALFVFIPMMGEYVIPDLLGGGKEMFLGKIMVEQFQKDDNWPFGSAIAGLLSSVLLFAIWIQSRWAVAVRPGMEQSQ
jgi:spermidine/putrescine transport system permease protein